MDEGVHYCIQRPKDNEYRLSYRLIEKKKLLYIRPRGLKLFKVGLFHTLRGGLLSTLFDCTEYEGHVVVQFRKSQDNSKITVAQSDFSWNEDGSFRAIDFAVDAEGIDCAKVKFIFTLTNIKTRETVGLSSGLSLAFYHELHGDLVMQVV